MSSSEPSAIRKIGAAAAAMLLASAVAGCQVRPLYSTGGETEAVLSSIGITEADTRIEQQVRNHLIFLLAGGGGEPAAPEYMLELNVAVRNIGVLIDTTTDVPRAGRIVATADFNLARESTGETVRYGKRSTVALVDFPVQEFAKIRATRDAENRAARELAELIRADIAASLARR